MESIQVRSGFRLVVYAYAALADEQSPGARQPGRGLLEVLHTLSFFFLSFSCRPLDDSDKLSESPCLEAPAQSWLALSVRRINTLEWTERDISLFLFFFFMRLMNYAECHGLRLVGIRAFRYLIDSL